MELTDKETQIIRKYLNALIAESDKPRKNRIYNLVRMIRLQLVRAERREKGRLL